MGTSHIKVVTADTINLQLWIVNTFHIYSPSLWFKFTLATFCTHSFTLQLTEELSHLHFRLILYTLCSRTRAKCCRGNLFVLVYLDIVESNCTSLFPFFSAVIRCRYCRVLLTASSQTSAHRHIARSEGWQFRSVPFFNKYTARHLRVKLYTASCFQRLDKW